jgi:putative sugar O-methyltransferase
MTDLAPDAVGGSGSLPGLRPMFDEMRRAPEAVQPSGYWQFLNGMNLAQLETHGFDEFKRTINGNYFQWLPTSPREPQFRAVLRWWLRHPIREPLGARVLEAETLDSRVGNPLQSARRRRAYGLYVALLWEYARRHAPPGTLERLQEPDVGDPLLVRYGDRLITQDLGNSALEYGTITAALGGGPAPGERVVELGGGYGRLAWVFLQERPDLRYVLVDIPPALAIAEQYLATLFGDRRLFRFRHFDHQDEVRDELDAAQIAFLTPNQLELLEPLDAALFVNISSLHEMRHEQIAYYLDVVARHTAGCFYTKQSITSRNPHDGVIVRRSEYPIPSTWRPLLNRRHPIQTSFFEALYDVGGD